MRSLRYLAVLGGLLLPLIAGHAAAAEPLAQTLFGSKALPSATAPQSFGFYSKGCLAGGVAIAVDGPHWQAMRVSRNRRWGHPAMITLLEKLSREAAQDGWPGLLLGDISQPRGGPMLTGHASHQIGLDADIWFTPMPNRRFTTNERENVGARSLIKDGSLNVDDRLWTPAHAALLKRAAGYGEVERILVHPGIKHKGLAMLEQHRSEAAVAVEGPRDVATLPATANAFLPTPPGRELPVPWPRPDP